MTGAQLITEERREQIQRHNRTVVNDVNTNTNNELARAALRLTMIVAGITAGVPEWPAHWDQKICAKMDAKEDFEKMIIAGAFIAADLDRRQAKGCRPEKTYDEFTQACRPLMQYMAENHHPHHKAVVTNTDAELLEGVKTTGRVMDYIKD